MTNAIARLEITAAKALLGGRVDPSAVYTRKHAIASLISHGWTLEMIRCYEAEVQAAKNFTAGEKE